MSASITDVIYAYVEDEERKTDIIIMQIIYDINKIIQTVTGS